MRNKISSKLGLGFVIGLLLFSSVVYAQLPTIRTFQDLINLGRQIGVFEFVLPFLLVFGILFGLMLKSGIFGDASKNDSSAQVARTISLIVALTAAGFIVIYTPVGFTFSQFLTRFVANSIVMILFTIVALIFVTMFVNTGTLGTSATPLKDHAGLLFIIIAIVSIGIYIQAGGGAIFPGPVAFGIPVEMLIIIGVIVLIGILIWRLVGGGGGASAAGAGT